MKYFSIIIALLTFLTVSTTVAAQATNCNATNATQFVACANDNAISKITLSGAGSGSVVVTAITDLQGNTIDMNNKNLTLPGGTLINTSTVFIGNGSVTLNVDGTTFTNSSGRDVINNAIRNCTTCTTLAQVLAFLPVELLSFEASLKENVVLLNWTTASEASNDFFLLEYSSNGTQFTTLATLQSKGDSHVEQYYQYLDYPASKGQHYYRLSQYDLDGTSAQLGLVTVKQTEEGSISLYPNPVSVGKYLTLEGIDNRGDNIRSARLISANGQQWPINYTGSHQLLLPTQLAPGLYYLQLVTNSSSQNLPVQIIR